MSKSITTTTTATIAGRSNIANQKPKKKEEGAGEGGKRGPPGALTTTLVYYYVHTPRTPQQSYIERRQHTIFSRSILEILLAIDTPGTWYRSSTNTNTTNKKTAPPQYKTLRRYYCTSRSLVLPSGSIRYGTIQNETFRNGTIPYGTIRVRRHLFVEPCGTEPYGTNFSRT